MNLTDYPTPECDRFKSVMPLTGHHEMNLARNLERRLAACREALELVLRRGQGMQRSDQYLHEVLNVCRQTLTETAPK